MSSIHSKNGSGTSLLSSNGASHASKLKDLDEALRAKDEGTLNVFLHNTAARAKSDPEAFRQVFSHLHQLLTDSARHGTPMQHKAEVSTFLAEQGLKQLRSLVAEVMQPRSPDDLHKNVAEARALLAAGYGGKETVALTHKVNLRSFGEARAATDARQGAASKAADRGSKPGLKDALAAARKGVSLAGHGAAERLAGAVKKGRGKVPGGDEG